MALVLDAGPLYAALDTGDSDHARCLALIEASNERLVIPSPVLVEVDFLMRRVGRPDRFLAVLEDVAAGAFEIAAPTPADLRRVIELLTSYADLGVAFTDAVVLAIVERLGEAKLATLDRRHFAAMRPRHVDALELLPA